MNPNQRVLRLYLPGSWPRLPSSCCWAVLARNGEIVSRGSGDAESWPPAEECEAILTADQVSWLSVTLPEKMGRDADRIISYALEEKLLEPPEVMHIVVVSQANEGSEKSAIAIRRARLSEIVDSIAGRGRRLDRLFSEMQFAQSTAGGWVICRFDDSTFLRMGRHLGLAVDWPGTAPPDALLLAVSRARSRGELPHDIKIQLPASIASVTDAWTAVLGVRVVAGEAFDPLAASSEVACNLLTGSFAPPGKIGTIRRFQRFAIVTMLVSAVLHTVMSLGEWAWLVHQGASLRAQAVAQFREAVPDSKVPLLDPSVQLHREANRVLHERGRVGHTDMLAMLAALGKALPPGAQARRIRFDPSALEFVAVLPSAAVQRLGPALRPHGYAIDATLLRSDSAGTEYRIRVRVI